MSEREPPRRTLVKELGEVIAAHPISHDTSKAPTLNRYVADKLDVPLALAQRTTWLLLLMVADTKDGSDKPFPFKATRHLLGLVEYPPGLHDPIPDIAETAKQLHGTSGVNFYELDRTLAGQRRLIATIAGGYGRGRTTLNPRSERASRRKGRIDEVAEFVLDRLKTLLADPEVTTRIVHQADQEALQHANEPVVTARGKSLIPDRQPAIQGPDQRSRLKGKGVPTRAREGLARPGRLRLVAAVAAITAVVAVGYLNRGANDNPRDEEVGSTSSNTPGTDTPSSPSAQEMEQMLSQIEPCRELSPDSPLAQQLEARHEVMVDGRCDPDPDAPVGAYSWSNQGAEPLERLANGRLLDDGCIVRGENIRNHTGTGDSRWIRYAVDDATMAFVPAIWTKGERGLPQCG